MNPEQQPTTPAAPAPAAPADNTPPEWAQALVEQTQRLTEQNEALQAEVASLKTPPAPTPEPTDPYKDWHPKSWSDVPRTAEQIAEEKARTVVNEELEAREAARKEAEEAANNARKEVDDELDKAEAELIKGGLLPAVTNDKDPSDPGKVARKELYGLAYKFQTTDLHAVAQQMKANHDAGIKYDPETDSYLKVNTPPAGSYAPVGSSSAATGPSSGKPTYKDIHEAKSLYELAARAGLQ